MGSHRTGWRNWQTPGGLNPPSTHVECGFDSRPGHIYLGLWVRKNIVFATLRSERSRGSIRSRRHWKPLTNGTTASGQALGNERRW